MTSWDEIGLHYGLDKASSHHGYLDVYQELLEKREVSRLLELGVAGGRSLAFWQYVLPDALIVGVDNDEHAGALQRLRRHVIIADVADPAAMAAVHTLYGPFDVIIDDASHKDADVSMAFEELYPRLVPGGVYVIEDLDGADPWVEGFNTRWHGRWVPCRDQVGYVEEGGLIVVEKL